MTWNGNEVKIDIYDEGGTLDPDSFRNFLTDDLKDIDDKADSLQASLYYLFVELGLAKENKVAQVNNNWDEHNYQFQNFKWEGEEPALMVSLKTPIFLTSQAPQIKSGYMHEYGHWLDVFKKEVMQEINNWADKIHLQQQQEPNLFKGTQWEHQPVRSFKQEFAIKPEIEIKPMKNSWQKPESDTPMAMYMSISFEPFTKDEDFHDVVEFIQFLDKNYARFTTIVNNIYKKIIDQFLRTATPLS